MDKDKFSRLIYTINENTGEIVDQIKYSDESSKVVLKYQVDSMLNKAKCSKELDSNLLYHWCKLIQSLNNMNQIRTFGNKLNDKIEDLLIEQGIVCAYVLKCIKLAHPFTHILKKSERVQVKTWTELWEIISCTNRTIQNKVKKFLEENKLIKAVPIKKDNGKTVKLFVLNPYLYKNSSHAGQFACIVWQESAKPNINIDFYAYMWLVSQDVIVMDNNSDYDQIVSEYFMKRKPNRKDKKK